MDLIKLLDIANPKTIKDTINAMIGITDTANTNANEAKTLSQTAATNSASAKQTAEEALAIIEEADARSEEASLLAEQAAADADDAVDTAELALNTANAARSAVDQAIDLGQWGTFVHNTNGIALAHAYMTDDVTQTDDTTLDRYYTATPKLVRDALVSYYTKTEANTLLSNKADLTNSSQVVTLGGLKDGNNANYKLNLPDTTNWNEDKIIATTDQLGTSATNPTLLINGDFRINQRGKTSYTSNGYTVDRWYNKGLTIDKRYTNRITINSTSQNVGYFEQSIPLEIDQLYGKTITISADVRAITVPSGRSIKLYLKNCASMDAITRYWESDEITTTGKVSFTVTLPAVLSTVNLVAAIKFTGGSGSSITLNYIKVEFGGTATLFIPEVDGMELMRCQRYYRKVTGGEYSIFGTGVAFGNKRIEIFISHPTTMRLKEPAFGYGGALRITQRNVGVGSLSDNTLSLSLDASAGTYDSVVIRADLTNALSDTSSGFILQSGYDTSAYLEFDAEVY